MPQRKTRTPSRKRTSKSAKPSRSRKRGGSRKAKAYDWISYRSCVKDAKNYANKH